jgi:hypothetical protein
MDFRIRKTDKGYLVEKRIAKWSLLGLKYKWIPFVKSTGLECAWIHSKYEYAIMNLIDEIKKENEL